MPDKEKVPGARTARGGRCASAEPWLVGSILAAMTLTGACGQHPAAREAVGKVETADAAVSCMDAAPSIEQGTAGIGSACKSDGDCGKPMACIDSQCTRRKKAGEGETCGDRSDCEKGLFCIKNICRASLSPPGGDCATYQDCEPGPVGTLCFQEKCTSLGDGSAGAFCELDEHCSSPLVCSGFACRDPKKAKQKTGKTGDDCLTFAGCLSGYCVLGKCSSNALGSGESCRIDSDCESRICLQGACRDTYLQPGEKCDYDSECEIPLCINGSCAEEASEPGGACDTDSDCSLPAVCIAGKCRLSLGGKGEACSTSDDCSAGLACRADVCG